MNRLRPDPVTLGTARFLTATAGPFLVTEASFPSRLTLAPHLHDRTVLGVTLHGEFDSVMAGRTLVCRPGTVHTEPAGERHANHFQAGGTRVVILQPDPRWEGLPGPTRAFLDRISHVACGDAVGLGHRLAAELRTKDAWSSLAVEGLSLEVLAAASRAAVGHVSTTRPPAWVVRVRERLNDVGPTPPRIADLADDAGVHPVHLARVFRRVYGASIGTYARRARLEWARDRLHRTSESVAAVAAAAGFTDQSHLTRLFGRSYGVTPAAYRRDLGRRRRPTS